jgi:hypothetical protein
MPETGSSVREANSGGLRGGLWDAAFDPQEAGSAMLERRPALPVFQSHRFDERSMGTTEGLTTSTKVKNMFNIYLTVELPPFPRRDFFGCATRCNTRLMDRRRVY